MLYSAYGMVLSVNHAFPELRPARGTPRYEVCWNTAAESPQNGRWGVLWRSASGEPWVTMAHGDGEHYFRFQRYMAVRAAGNRIDVARSGHADQPTLRHLFLDQALPLVLAAHGRFVLHASAVLVGDRAVLLVGATGTGKSTLAAHLSRLGGAVLADDGVLVQRGAAGLEAVPSYAGLRLFEDSAAASGCTAAGNSEVAEYTSKRRFIPPGDAPAGQRAVALGPIYLLDDGPGDMRFSRLSRRDVAVALIQHTYGASPGDRAGLRAQLELVTAWSRRLAVWRITFPRRLSQAGVVAAAIAAHADRQGTALPPTPPGGTGPGAVDDP